MSRPNPVIAVIAHTSYDRIKELDMFRGWAAIGVATFHIFHILNINTFNYGVTGVDLFFLISGFVIYKTIENSKNRFDFLINRFSRLYPVYWTVVSLVAIVIFIFHQKQDGLLRQYLFNMTMFQHYFKVEHLDFPYWTLTVEMQFYGLVYLLHLLNSLKPAKYLTIVGLLICLLYHYLLKSFAFPIYDIIHDGIPLINHMPLFLAGMLFYEIYLNRKYSNLILIIMCYLTQLALYSGAGQAHGFINFQQYSIVLFIYFLLFLLLTYSSLLYKINNSIFVWLGSVSYALYLCHDYFSAKIFIPILKTIIPNIYFAGIFCLLLNILVAHCLTTYIDKPLSMRLKKVLSKALS